MKKELGKLLTVIVIFSCIVFLSLHVRFIFGPLNYLFLILVSFIPLILLVRSYSKREFPLWRLKIIVLSLLSCFAIVSLFLITLTNVINRVGFSDTILERISMRGSEIVISTNNGCGAASCKEIISVKQEKKLFGTFILHKSLYSKYDSSFVRYRILDMNRLEITVNTRENNIETTIVSFKDNVYFD